MEKGRIPGSPRILGLPHVPRATYAYREIVFLTNSPFQLPISFNPRGDANSQFGLRLPLTKSIGFEISVRLVAISKVDFFPPH